VEYLLHAVILGGILLILYISAFPARRFVLRKLGWIPTAELRLAPALFVIGILGAVTMTTIKILHDLGIIS